MFTVGKTLKKEVMEIYGELIMTFSRTRSKMKQN